MARSVVAGHPLATDRFFSLPGLPCLSDPAHSIYSEHLPNRLEKFPQPEKGQAANLATVPEGIEIEKDALCSLPWTRQLRHDGESVFWLLVWWAIHLRAKPSKNSEPSKIKGYTFGLLANVDLETKHDGRESFLSSLAEKVPWLDPAYQELEPLFLTMAHYLTRDLYWAKGQMKEPDFLHEALQRIILNFLMENNGRRFMHLKKDPDCRELVPSIPRHAYMQGTPSKRSRMTDDPEEEVEVSLLSSPALVHLIYSCRVRHPKGHVRTTSELSSLEKR
jgi:hypothetical protein